MKPFITIFTPTYNRAYILPILYRSLLDQTNKEFEWLIVDDGSTDDTKNLIDQYIQENKIPIRYFSQENQGKHVAINKGALNAKGLLFMTVDSDDLLVDNAIEILANKYELIKDSEDVAAIVAVTRHINDTSLMMTNQRIPQQDWVLSPYELKYKHKVVGEFSMAFKTAILKNYPFPAFIDERYMKLTVVYNRIAKKYKNIYIQEPIYLAEYLSDGLTAKYWSLMKSNPKGAKLSFKELVNYPIPLIDKLKAINMYWNFQNKEKNLSFKDKSQDIPYFLILIVLLLRKTKIFHFIINKP